MILTKEQIDLRVKSEKNIVNIKEEDSSALSNIVEYKDHINNKTGRPGSKNLTEEQRVSIGFISAIAGDEAAAEIFNVAEGTAHRLRSASVSRNPNSTGVQSTKDMNLQNKINERLSEAKLTAQERAAEKLLETLGLITKDDLANAKIKDKASIAKDMSQVMKNLNSSNSSDGDKNSRPVKIVMHQPKPSKEEHFETIEIEL